MSETRFKFIRWLLGSPKDALKRLRSLTPIFWGTPNENPGDDQGNNRGVLAGGVAWPVEKDEHDGVSFLGSDSCPAEYIHEEKKVYVLDELGKRHPNQRPFVVDKSVYLAVPLYGDAVGHVNRGFEYGSAGLKKNIFHPSGPNLIAHHLQPKPPEKSTQVYDVDGRHGGLHTPLRVVEWITELCQGATGVFKKVFAPVLNFTFSGDGTPAHGAAKYSDGLAVHSNEAFGPLRRSARKHKIGDTGEGDVRQGAIDTDRAIHSDGTDRFSAPFFWEKTEWEPCGKAPFPRLVRTRMDSKTVHQALCGLAKGMWREQTWADKASPTETPPPDSPPGDPPPPNDPPPPTTGPPTHPRIPQPTTPLPALEAPPGWVPPQSAFPIASTRPTNSGPSQEEQPSTRGIATHNAPEPFRGIGNVAFDIPGISRETAWVLGHDMTEAQFWALPRVSDRVSYGVNESATPNQSGGERWPLKFNPDGGPTMAQHASGVWYGKRGHGPGFEGLLPGGLEADMAFKASNGHKLPSGYTPTLTDVAVNYKSGSNEVKTLPAMGALKEGVSTVVSGAELSLDYTDDVDEPNLMLQHRDENGTLTTAPSFKVKALKSVSGPISVRSVTDFAQNITVANTDPSVPAVKITGIDETSVLDFGIDEAKGPWRKHFVKAMNSTGGGAGQTLFDVPTVTDTTGDVYVSVQIVANTGVTTSRSIKKGIAFYNNGGTVTVGTEYVDNNQDFGAFGGSVTLTNSGASVRIQFDDNGTEARVRAIITREHSSTEEP